jgi:hypothetical protein
MRGSSPLFQISQSHLKKSKWSAEEDEQLRTAIRAFGTDSWNKIAALVPSRTGKQCRERWIGQLAPFVSRETWSPEEDGTLIRQHAASGNRWTEIAGQLPGRSALQVKNRWNSLLRHQMVEYSSNFIPVTDILESRPSQLIFEPVVIDDGLFGTAFQEFQANMLKGLCSTQ